jgi:RNA polymerase sigma-70 factor, ECF subfamily
MRAEPAVLLTDPVAQAGGAASAEPQAGPAVALAPSACGPTDEELVERVRGSDTAAFGVLVERHMRRAFGVAYRLLGHREDAEDLVQEAFAVALERIDTFSRGRTFAPWFFRIVVNRGLNARKARSLRQTEALHPEVASGGSLPDSHAERAEMRRRIGAAMATLPERQRVALLLFEVEGFSGSEIAEILDIPSGTVRWHIHQGRATLRSALRVYERTEV